MQQITTKSITESLGIQGWTHLDPLILAALTTESPLLLIGPHGTAKSLLVERIAAALGLSMRHYNASLINYDDLVGIPLPEPGTNRLQFVTTPGAIWDAEFVFFDEISRCRPDLQNKMFPIVHERKVAGIALAKLRHRWAAMNPPAPEDPDLMAGDYYLGSEALDPALVDRFPFIIPVPAWSQLSRDDRRKLVSRRTHNTDVTSTYADWLPALVEQCRAVLPTVEESLQEWLDDYIVTAVDLLEQAKLGQSPRRAHMLARSLAAIHAARLILEGDGIDLENSAELTLAFGVPQNASEVPPSRSLMIAIHRQAWEISSLSEDNAWRRVLEELDAAKRVALADQLGMSDADVSRLVTQSLGSSTGESRRIGLGALMWLAFHKRRDLSAAAWEPLAQFAARVLEPGSINVALKSGPMSDIWNEIVAWMLPLEEVTTLTQRLERNFVLQGFPDQWLQTDWKEALETFRQDMKLFALNEERES